MTRRPDRKRRRGPGAVLLTLAALLAGCGPREGLAVADPVRSTLRVGSAQPLELHTQAGMGQRVFWTQPERIWALLPQVFETLDIPVTTHDARGAEMGNEGYLARRVEGKRMSSYVDCGTGLGGPMADTHDVTLMALVRLAPTADGGTQVTAYVDATARARATRGNPIHCQSRNVLEGRITDLVAQLLVGPGTRP